MSYLRSSFAQQNYGTIVTGRSGETKTASTISPLQNSAKEFGFQSELEWNFGCMDFDWLRRYCKTQVNSITLSRIPHICIANQVHELSVISLRF